ncbi:hypothetical protein [Flammeovirga agarivorans]|uniref:Uncharacterized protein n=1 Tax=Flammeovirga agarivorans TaxID=2726742 RepID=A0A7X8SRA8_9BACT|nr:hypothetical protein [Flammeovirga agarivorans]NLR94961.1 hypothetical protein [Flammeovirga agarivorans]
MKIIHRNSITTRASKVTAPKWMTEVFRELNFSELMFVVGVVYGLDYNQFVEESTESTKLLKMYHSFTARMGEELPFNFEESHTNNFKNLCKHLIQWNSGH